MSLDLWVSEWIYSFYTIGTVYYHDVEPIIHHQPITLIRLMSEYHG